MASRYFTDAVGDGDTTNVNRWSATDGGATGASVPGNSDTAYFLSGDTDVAANTAFAAGVVEFGRNFRGNVNGLLSNYASAIWTVESVAPGKHFQIGAAAATTVVTFNIVSTGGGRVTIVGGAGSVLSNLYAGAVGDLVVDASVAVTNVYNAGMLFRTAYNVTPFTILQLRGGGSVGAPHTIERAISTFTASRCVALTKNGVGITTEHLESATHTHDSSGTISTLNAYPGSRQLPGATPYTISLLNIWEGGYAPKGNNKVTISATVPFGNIS